MSVWRSAGEIERAFFVSADTLAAYGRRGNLSFRRDPNGAILYEEAAVARLFRSRSGMMSVSAEAAAKPGFGILGATYLGHRPTTQRSGRQDIRARAMQAARDIVEQARKASAERVS
jgi:hypothetical protein